MKNINSKVLSMLLILVVSLSLFVVPVSADIQTLQGQAIELIAAVEEAEVGDTIEVEIEVTDASYLWGAGVVITWDPTMLYADPTASRKNFKCYTFPADDDTGSNIFAASSKANVEKVAEGRFAVYGLSGYDMEDYPVRMSLGTMKFTVLEGAAGKNVAINVGPVEYNSDGNISGGSYAVINETTNVLFESLTGTTVKVAGGEPTVPTADDLGLVTDDQVAKISENVMTNNGYAINKALVFKSAIYANAAVDACGTVITCEDRQGELVIPVKDSGEVDNNVKTFYAAVTSIRDINLDKKFTAKAYADVTVGESQERVYAKDAATAVYND